MNYKKKSFNRGFFYYLQQSYLVYDCKMGSFQFTAEKYLRGSQQAFLIIWVILI